MNTNDANITVPGPILIGIEVLARSERSDVPEQQAVRTELRQLIHHYTAGLRAAGVSREQMIATVRAVVRRALARVWLNQPGAFLLEVLDWGLEGYYEGARA